VSKKAKQASAFVKYKIQWLAETHNEALVRAILARLRQGVGKAPGSQPDLWDITMNNLPEELLSKSDKPTYGEWAVHTALTLFALHQQGKDLKKQCMYKDGNTLGVAARILISHDTDNEEAVKKRFLVTAVSDSFERFSWLMRGMIQLLKAKNIPLDYARLTEDLYWYQFPNRRDSVRLKWGQDFYRVANVVNDTSDKNL
jgi:CRISPR system Cascade subunit CasB